MNDSPRWYVERPKSFEDVGAETFSIESGALVFRTGDRIEYVLAAGQWLSVTPETEGES